MLLTGFEIRGNLPGLRLREGGGAAQLAAWSLVTLWVFAIFWHFTTGECASTSTREGRRDDEVLHGGHLQARSHPFRVSTCASTTLAASRYLFVLLFIGPLIWISGLALSVLRQLGVLGIGELSLQWWPRARAGRLLMLLS